MAHRIVVVGGGTGGTIAANRLRRRCSPDEAEIVVVDRDDGHVYQPGLLFLPFGLADGEIVRPRHRQLLPGVAFREALVERIDLAGRRVHLADGTSLAYDALVVATGAVPAPETTPGLAGPGWMERVFSFYTPQGATALREALHDFRSGRLVVAVVDEPVKAPMAPLEFCFLADWFYRQHRRRSHIDLTYVTPLEGAATEQLASERLGGLLAGKHVDLVPRFRTASVDGSAGILIATDGRQVPFDLAVVVPRHTGAPCIQRSPGLGDEQGFVPADPRTLQTKAAPEVFVIGDAAGIPAAKTGSVTHHEGEVVAENVRRYLNGEPLDAHYDGHASCFVETGFHKALFVGVDDGTEGRPERSSGRLGLPLLDESRLSHLAKLLYQPLYWHALLPGRDLPGMSPAHPEASGGPLHPDGDEDEKAHGPAPTGPPPVRSPVAPPAGS